MNGAGLHMMGFDHEKLTYRYAGRDFRLADVAGEGAMVDWFPGASDRPRTGGRAASVGLKGKGMTE